MLKNFGTNNNGCLKTMVAIIDNRFCVKMWHNYALTYKGVSLDILTRPTNLFLSRISSNLRLNVLSGTKPFWGETEGRTRFERGNGWGMCTLLHTAHGLKLILVLIGIIVPKHFSFSF